MTHRAYLKEAKRSVGGILAAAAVFLLPLIIAACSQSTQHAGQSTSASTNAPLTVVDPRTPSSLEAMQKGLASVTPPSSPLKDIFFEFDTFDLGEEAREILKVNAVWLNGNPAILVEIEGHTDDWGSNEYNLALGAKRAETAKEYLLTLGVQPERVKMVSYGEEAPACLETSEDCRRKNRRARFVILKVLTPTS